MLLNESVSNFPAPAIAWSDIARVCRRVCMLRERGQSVDAEQLRAGELMAMVSAVRTPTDTDATVTERLNAIFAVESERVANAAVLAELLVPTLLDKLPVQSRHASAIDAAPSPTTAPLPTTPEKTAAPRAGSIADFIDEMIAQEKPPARPSSGSQRRAS